jgi:hypothetical protein
LLGVAISLQVRSQTSSVSIACLQWFPRRAEPDVPPELDEDCLEGVVVLPRREHVQLGRVNLRGAIAQSTYGLLSSKMARAGQEDGAHLSVCGVYAGEVDAGEERDRGRLVRVGRVAHNRERVDPVFVHGLRSRQWIVRERVGRDGRRVQVSSAPRERVASVASACWAHQLGLRPLSRPYNRQLAH